MKADRSNPPACTLLTLNKGLGPHQERGVAIFAKDFSGHPARKNQQKCTRPLMPSAAPIRPRHLVSTQQGVET